MKIFRRLIAIWLCLLALGAVQGIAYADDDGGGDDGDGDNGGDDGGGNSGGNSGGNGGEGGDSHWPYFDVPESNWRRQGADYERAHRALLDGEILPVEKILESLNPQVRSGFIDMELEYERQKWIYEFKYLDEKGKLIEYYVDGATGKLLPDREKNQ